MRYYWYWLSTKGNIGLNTLKRFDQALPSGLQTSIVPQEHRFRYYVQQCSKLMPLETHRFWFHCLSWCFVTLCCILILERNWRLSSGSSSFQLHAISDPPVLWECHLLISVRIILKDFRKHRRNFNKGLRNSKFSDCRVFLALNKQSLSPIPTSLTSLWAMESRGVTKRARTDAVEAEQPWKRMVLKLLFLVCRITDWALQILMPKKPDRMQPFSVWPMADIPEKKGPGPWRAWAASRWWDPRRRIQRPRHRPPAMLRKPQREPTMWRQRTSRWWVDHQHVPIKFLASYSWRGNKAQTTDGCSGDVPWLEVSSAVTSHGHRCSPTGRNQWRARPVSPAAQWLQHRRGLRHRRHQNVHGRKSAPTIARPMCEICGKVLKNEARKEEGADQGAPEDDTRGDRRVRGVPEVPSLAATSQGCTELGIECEESQDVPRALKGLNEDENVLEDTTELTKQAERALHQAEAALRTAEVAWKELMSLVCTEPDQMESAGWKRFQQEVLDPKDPSKVRNSKALYKFAHVLGTDKDQAKVVAEVFNPNRFGPQTKRHGLVKGQSFDLELGTDLLEPRNQEMVLEYLNYVQPGLTAISPPCRLFTILQNLNHARRTEEGMKTYLQPLRWAKELLRFATKVALLVMSYGGKFLLENPLMSKAWQEKYLNELMMDERVHLAVADQCMYGLTSIQEAPQRKPTPRRSRRSLDSDVMDNTDMNLFLEVIKVVSGPSRRRFTQRYWSMRYYEDTGRRWSWTFKSEYTGPNLLNYNNKKRNMWRD